MAPVPARLQVITIFLTRSHIRTEMFVEAAEEAVAPVLAGLQVTVVSVGISIMIVMSRLGWDRCDSCARRRRRRWRRCCRAYR